MQQPSRKNDCEYIRAVFFTAELCLGHNIVHIFVSNMVQKYWRKSLWVWRTTLQTTNGFTMTITERDAIRSAANKNTNKLL